MGVRSDSRVSSIENLEWAFARGGVGAVVVLESTDGEPIGPVVLSVVKDNPEVFLDFLIDTFGLAIGLRMERGGSV